MPKYLLTYDADFNDEQETIEAVNDQEAMVKALAWGRIGIINLSDINDKPIVKLVKARRQRKGHEHA